MPCRVCCVLGLGSISGRCGLLVWCFHGAAGDESLGFLCQKGVWTCSDGQILGTKLQNFENMFLLSEHLEQCQFALRTCRVDPVTTPHLEQNPHLEHLWAFVIY